MILGFYDRNKYVHNVFGCRSDVYVAICVGVLLSRNDITFSILTQLKLKEVMYFTPTVQIHCVTWSIALVIMNNRCSIRFVYEVKSLVFEK
jgi:hypothetical protein